MGRRRRRAVATRGVAATAVRPEFAAEIRRLRDLPGLGVLAENGDGGAGQRDALARQAAEVGVPFEAYDEWTRERLRRLLDPGRTEVAMRLHPGRWARFLEEGVLVSGLEAERHPLDFMPAGPYQLRSEFELSAFGSHPLYGYVCGPGEEDLLAPNAVSIFGTVKVVLNADVRGRCTVVLGDSMEADDRALPSPLTDPDPASVPYYLNLGGMERVCCEQGKSFEVHVHGGVKLSDVARVVDPGPALPLPDPVKALAFVKEAERRATGVARSSRLHGPEHWRQVAQVGLMLAQAGVPVDLGVLVAFAAVHDTRRLNDGEDPEHGPRAAELADAMRGDGYLDWLDGDQFAALREAVATHTAAERSDDATIGACFDADRLTLWRIGVCPVPWLLSSGAAISLMAPAGAALADGPPFGWRQLIAGAWS
jgi:uncharacterized protein